MAPIRHPNSRIEAIGKIRDIMQLNAPSEAMIEVAKEWTETCDPYTKYLIDCYLELEKQRMEFFKMAGSIFEVPELPLVLSDSVESVEKTSAAIKILKQVGAYADAEKAKASVQIHPGRGKMRNRRYISRKGPLIVYGTEGLKIVKAFHNIPGVDVIIVERLNLFKLAPGGHVGRFIIWTKSAFEKFDSVYGTFDKPSKKKKGFVIPRSKMLNADLARIINSNEVQAVVKPTSREVKRRELKRNPLKSISTLLKLNPYAGTARRMSLLAEAQTVRAKNDKIAKKRSPLSTDLLEKLKMTTEY